MFFSVTVSAVISSCHWDAGTGAVIKASTSNGIVLGKVLLAG